MAFLGYLTQVCQDAEEDTSALPHPRRTALGLFFSYLWQIALVCLALKLLLFRAAETTSILLGATPLPSWPWYWLPGLSGLVPMLFWLWFARARVRPVWYGLIAVCICTAMWSVVSEVVVGRGLLMSFS